MRFMNELLLEQPPWIMRSLVCSLLVIAATWLIALATTLLSAAVRHRIFSLGFAGLLLAPAAVTITDGWNPIISLSHAKQFPVAATSVMTVPSSMNLIPPDDFSRNTGPSPRSNAIDQTSLELTDESQEKNAGADPALAVTVPAQITPPAASRTTSRMQLPGSRVLLGATWVAGFLLLLFELAKEWYFIRRIVHGAVPITDVTTLTMLREAIWSTERLKFQRVRKLPSLLCSSSITVPIATGIFVPMIILPAGFGKWSNERLRHVLLHELAHIDRHDLLTSLMARLACLLHWFNPLVWMAAQRMNLERELACDDFLIRLGENAESYATDLFDIAAALQARLRMAQLATPIATRTNLKLRIERLTNLKLDRRGISNQLTITTSVGAVLTLTLLATMSPSWGIAQDRSAKSVPVGDDAAVILSGELPGDWVDQLKVMPKLRKLTIRFPAVKNLNAARLRELSNLTEFSAEDFSIDTGLADIVAINVAQLPKLRSLQFHRTGLTHRGMEALRRSPATELILDGEELITDTDFQHVAAMPSITSLVVDSTPIEAAGFISLQSLPTLTRLAVRRHPAGTIEHDSESRIKAIAGLKHLVELEICDSGYNRLATLKTCPTLRRLKLTRCGGRDATQSLKQLTQVQQIELDDTDFHEQSFQFVKSNLAEIGIELVDVSRMTSELLTLDSSDPESATEVARRALAAFDVGKQFPSFWIAWHQQWSKIPTMSAEPTRTIHRLKRALTAERDIQPWQQDIFYAYAPGQFLMRNQSLENKTPDWQQTTYGDANFACSREGRPGKPFSYFFRGGVREFEDSMGHQFPRQLYITHQHFWWGQPTHHNVTTTSVGPERVAYQELPAENFAGETCRVFEAPGRGERLWVDQSTGRLRGHLHHIHQGYFTPFYKQAIVTKLVGRRLESQEEYQNLFKGPKAISAEVGQQLSQAWSEHEFNYAYPSNLMIFDDYREIATGKWFPFKVTNAGWHHNENNQRKYDFTVSESTVSELAIDRSDLQPYWDEFTPSAGDKVQDQRQGVSIDYQFDPNRTEADIQKLVYDQMLKHARSALQVEELQGPFTKLLGKPAPKLEGGSWLGDRPELKGKRYLLHFWATWCGPCKNDVPLLNSIAKNSIVIGVHPDGTNEEQISEAIKESKMAYPTVVAPHGAKDVMGYPTNIYPYYVEVDEHGNVAKHGFLEDVLGSKSRSTAPADRSSSIHGSILEINDKRDLVILSIGEQGGLQAGQSLEVLRDDNTTTQLRVVSLYKNLSVARLTDLSQAESLRVGNKVRD